MRAISLFLYWILFLFFLKIIAGKSAVKPVLYIIILIQHQLRHRIVENTVK